jgi:hypothetical protein
LKGGRLLQKLFEKLSQKEIDKMYFKTSGSPVNRFEELRKLIQLGGLSCSEKAK